MNAQSCNIHVHPACSPWCEQLDLSCAASGASSVVETGSIDPQIPADSALTHLSEFDSEFE
ncbi:MAG: hypothetical protein WBA57_24000, partial [Elainellaceae cyanobacterium]